MELQKESKAGGVCLARFAGSRFLEILPFAGGGYEVEMGTHALMARFSADGRGFVVESGTAMVVYADGHELWRAHPTVTAYDAGLSPALDQVALVGIDHTTKMAGIYCVARVGGAPRLIRSFGVVPVPPDPRAGRSDVELYLAQSSPPSWSHDGSHLLYAHNDHVFLFDMSTGTEREIMTGSAPAWSPDGGSIALRGTDGHVRIGSARFTDLHALKNVTSLGSSIRWSPTGAYLLVNESASGLSTDRCGYPTIFRVGDGAKYRVHGPCRKGDDGIGWLVQSALWVNAHQ